MAESILYGVGVGTGDPELLTLKAMRIIQQAPVVCYLVNHQGYSQARDIARLAFEAGNEEQQETTIPMPMQLDRKAANKAYDEAAIVISRQLSQGRDVVFLCEGDPLFFGSFTYVLSRLQNKYSCQIVPGISSLHTASATLVSPLTQQQESLAIVSGRHSDEKIRAALEQYDTVMVMKISQNVQRIQKLLDETGRTQQAQYIEYMGREQQKIIRDITQIPEDNNIYFSIILVTANITDD